MFVLKMETKNGTTQRASFTTKTWATKRIYQGAYLCTNMFRLYMYVYVPIPLIELYLNKSKYKYIYIICEPNVYLCICPRVENPRSKTAKQLLVSQNLCAAERTFSLSLSVLGCT